MKMGRYLATTLLFTLIQAVDSAFENEQSRKLLFDVAVSMAGIYGVSLVVLFFYLCIREMRDPGTWSDYSRPHPGINVISTYKFPEKPNDEKAAMAGKPTSANAATNDETDSENDEADYSNSWKFSRA